MNEEEWIDARLGKYTASRGGDAFAELKSGGWGVSRERYAVQLILERMNNRSYDNSYVTPAMRRGMATEAHARAYYARERSVDLIEAPEGHHLWITHPTIAMAGATPDSLIKGQPGIVEFKCPESHTHLERWDNRHNGKISKDYLLQIAFQLACLPEMEFADFVSFDPHMPRKMRMVVHRVQRDDGAVRQLEILVAAFLREVEERTAGYQADCN